VPKVEKILGLNLPGTPRATSACRGTPLFYFTSRCICWSWGPSYKLWYSSWGKQYHNPSNKVHLLYTCKILHVSAVYIIFNLTRSWKHASCRKQTRRLLRPSSFT
jgi:hypothetical protein